MKGIKASLHLTGVCVLRVSNHGVVESQGNVCLMSKSALQQSELHAVLGALYLKCY